MKYHSFGGSVRFMADPFHGNSFVRSLMEHLQTPAMKLDEHVNYILYDKQSSRMLSVVYLIGLA